MHQEMREMHRNQDLSRQTMNSPRGVVDRPEEPAGGAGLEPNEWPVFDAVRTPHCDVSRKDIRLRLVPVSRP